MVICLDLRTGAGCGAQNRDSAQRCGQCGMLLRFALLLRDPGARVGDYQIIRVIGHGAAGAVYEAEDMRTLQGHTDEVSCIAMCPDGQTLASASDDQTVRLWRIADGSELRVLPGYKGHVRSVAYSPDGQMLAIGSMDNSLRFWQISTNDIVNTIQRHKQGIWSIAFSPAGRMLASASEDKTIWFWRVDRGQ